MARKKLLLMIPAYNEEENIGNVLDQLEREGIPSMADILVIDDASGDATGQIVRERSYGLLTQLFHMGYGSTLQLGYKYAARRGYEYVIQMDADGQHDACNIPVIYGKLRKRGADGHCPDLVLGSRFLEGGSWPAISFLKKAAHIWFRRMIRSRTGQNIADPTTGLQGLSRNGFCYYAQYGNFDDQYPDANMILQMLLLGFRVEQVPAVMHPRMAGKGMHSGPRTAWYMFRMLASMLAVAARSGILKTKTGGTKA